MRSAGLALLLRAALAGPALAAPPSEIFRPVAFADLAGWAEDDHAAALRVLRETCPALPRPSILTEACQDAALGREGEARNFFERHFTPVEIAAGGFLTGYFEPELAGSLESGPGFLVPLLGPPDGEGPWPDRAAIEDGALDGRARPVAWLRDRVDAFTVHVQGSARLRLADGEVVRVGFAGRNGQPYTGIARLLVERLGLPPAAMTADRLEAWLRQNPDEGRALMRRNRSFIFFRRLSSPRPGEGPIGAAGVPVSAGRGLAIDRSVWPYGLPVWLEADVARPGADDRLAIRRLAVAQDTGAAILGPGRGDLFVGSGPEAGAQAALMRDRVRFVVLWPQGVAGPPAAPPLAGRP